MLNQLSISGLVTRLAKGELSSRAVTQACLDQIARVDGSLNVIELNNLLSDGWKVVATEMSGAGDVLVIVEKEEEKAK